MKLHFRPRHLLPLLAVVPIAYFAVPTTTKADGGGSAASTNDPANVVIAPGPEIGPDGLLWQKTITATGTTIVKTDGLGRVRERVDAAGKTTTYSYDGGGNLIAWRDANGNGEDKVYDALNRCISITDTTGSTRQFTYNAAGQVLTETDPKGQTTRYAYDAAGQRTTITDALGGVTHVAFDANGNQTSVTDAEGKTTKYTYDNLNRQVATAYPGHDDQAQIGTLLFDKVQLEFDAASRLSKITRQDGTAEALGYDFAGRLTTHTYLNADGSTESVDAYTFDSNNRILTATKGRYGNTVAYTYDTFGRTQSESLTTGGQTYTTQYTYDTDGQLIGMTYPSGLGITRNYTSRHQLAGLNANNQSLAAIQYDDAGRETQRTLGNGASQTRTYRQDNLLATIATTLPSGNDPASSLSYGYDSAKNLTAETFQGGGITAYSATMTQDAKNRLTGQAQTNGDNKNWNLTLEGDWAQYTGSTGGIPISQTRSHNDKHQITAIAGTTTGAPTHDIKGNTTLDAQGNQYQWDAQNQLQSITVAVAPPQVATAITFTYDALERRVSKTSNGATTLYISAGNQEIAEYQNGTLVKEHAYGTYVDEAIATKDAGGWKYRVMDRRYSTTALLDDQGQVVERYVYSPYGDTKVLNVDGSAKSGAPLMDVLWTGRKLDGETGNYYFRSRYFSPGLGRFLARDMAGYMDGWNLYEGYFAEKKDIDPYGDRDVIINVTVSRDDKPSDVNMEELQKSAIAIRSQINDGLTEDQLFIIVGYGKKPDPDQLGIFDWTWTPAGVNAGWYDKVPVVNFFTKGCRAYLKQPSQVGAYVDFSRDLPAKVGMNGYAAVADSSLKKYTTTIYPRRVDALGKSSQNLYTNMINHEVFHHLIAQNSAEENKTDKIGDGDASGASVRTLSEDDINAIKKSLDIK